MSENERKWQSQARAVVKRLLPERESSPSSDSDDGEPPAKRIRLEQPSSNVNPPSNTTNTKGIPPLSAKLTVTITDSETDPSEDEDEKEEETGPILASSEYDRALDPVAEHPDAPQPSVHNVQHANLIRKAGTKSLVNAKELYRGILVADSRPTQARVLFRCAKDAVYQAKQIISESLNNPGVLTIFGDGSAIPNDNRSIPTPGAYAIALLSWWPNTQSSLARNSSFQVPAVYESTNSELLAITEELNMAYYLRSGPPMITPWSDRNIPLHIYIFTDTREGMDAIKQGQNLDATELNDALAQPFVSRIVYLTHALAALNCRVTIRWLPGHFHSILGFQNADVLARWTANGDLQPHLATVLWGTPYSAPYRMIGPELQAQVVRIALRHPNLDGYGRGPSQRKYVDGPKPPKTTAAAVATSSPQPQDPDNSTTGVPSDDKSTTGITSTNSKPTKETPANARGQSTTEVPIIEKSSDGTLGGVDQSALNHAQSDASKS